MQYIVPSENGGKADVQWAAFTASSGEGLLLEYSCDDAAAEVDDPRDGKAKQRPAMTKGAQLSASRYSMEELENTSHRHLLPHQANLQSRPIHVHLDTAHCGVGGVGEGGSKLWATATRRHGTSPPVPGARWTKSEHRGIGSELIRGQPGCPGFDPRQHRVGGRVGPPSRA